MKKQTKILLGVGALAVVGYLVYKTKSGGFLGFANASLPTKKLARGLNTSSTASKGVKCGRSEVKTVTPSGYTYCQKQDSTYTIYDQNGNQIN